MKERNYPQAAVGEVSAADRETLISWAGGARANFLPSALSLRRAGYLAELGWRPRYPGLHTIVETAWEWHRSHPHGYAETATQTDAKEG